MKFEEKGNMGKVDLLQQHIMLKRGQSDNGEIVLSGEEVKEIEEQLSKFNHLMANMFYYENALKDDKYGALTSIIKELEPYYRNYNSEE